MNGVCYNCCCLVAQSCLTLCSPRDFSLADSSVYGIFSGKNTRLGCHFLFQGIFPAEVSNPHLLHCRRFFITEPTGKPICYDI